MVSLRKLVLAAALLLPATASAQMSTYYERPEKYVKVELGVGGQAFTEHLARATDPGGALDLRAVILPSAPLGIELGYAGGANVLNVKAVDDLDAVLLSNAGRAMLRANILKFVDLKTPVEPYIAAGVGYTAKTIAVENEINHDREDEVEFQDNETWGIPAAAGVDMKLGKSATVGVRGSYEYTLDDNTLKGIAKDDAQSFAATANFGMMF